MVGKDLGAIVDTNQTAVWWGETRSSSHGMC